MPDQKIIALTGSMGAGKSQAGRILAETWPVLDCDAINAMLLEPGQAGHEALLAAGLIPAGPIDKKALAARMFADEQLRRQVESILHPLIFAEVDAQCARQNTPVVFVEVPLLYEIQAADHFDEAWCVICDDEVALERLQQFRGFSRPEAQARLAAQLSAAYKASLADEVIDNSGTLAELRDKLHDLVEGLNEES